MPAMPGVRLPVASCSACAAPGVRGPVRHLADRLAGRAGIPLGKTPKEALRAQKRKVSDAIYKHLKADAARAAAGGLGGQPGNGSYASAAGSHPESPALRKSHSRTFSHPTTPAPHPEEANGTRYEKTTRTS